MYYFYVLHILHILQQYKYNKNIIKISILIAPRNFSSIRRLLLYSAMSLPLLNNGMALFILSMSVSVAISLISSMKERGKYVVKESGAAQSALKRPQKSSLSARTLSLLRATSPVISGKSSEVTHKFYALFFSRYPAFRHLFSLAHSSFLDESELDPASRISMCPARSVVNSQKNVSGSQVRAMASAIISYVSNIENSNRAEFKQVILKIANKHVSHHVTHDLYPHLGECLLASIADVLGDLATAEVINAWTDAYWNLADLLMVEEDRILEANISHNYGWFGFRPFIVRKQIESESICSVYLTPEDEVLPLPLFLPGQYITIRVTLSDSFTTHRNFSLSGPPGKDYYRISVKRIIGGEVSGYIHDSLRSGDRLYVSIPCGTFTLNPLMPLSSIPQNVVFISAGIGLTPLLSMVTSITEEKTAVDYGVCSSAATPYHKDFEEPPVERTWADSNIIFLHAAKNKRHDAFSSFLQKLAAAHSNLRIFLVYSEPRRGVDTLGKDYHSAGHISLDLLQSLIKEPDRTVVYLCGPDRFMKSVYHFLRVVGVPSDCIIYERFSAGNGSVVKE